ncbi:uncharacterized protein PAC_14126 [Phialocephala subalpina]|uniref:Uncharacterized protein n=1 Tax=Phialocephala subalpina TaxID=576137 RepID=A0A1L7XGT7_9HELO|nr:uncharacterized protein PAC_14126 [Phialocephala subalpina]
MEHMLVQSLLNPDPPSPENSIGNLANFCFKNRKGVSAPQLPLTPTPDPQHQLKDRHAKRSGWTPINSAIDDEDTEAQYQLIDRHITRSSWEPINSASDEEVTEAAHILMKLSTHTYGRTVDDSEAAETILQLQYQEVVFTAPPTLPPDLAKRLQKGNDVKYPPPCQKPQARHKRNTRQRPNTGRDPSDRKGPSLPAIENSTRDETEDEEDTTPNGAPEHSPRTPNVIHRRRRSIAYSSGFPSGLCIVVNDEDSDESQEMPQGPRRRGSSIRLI